MTASVTKADVEREMTMAWQALASAVDSFSDVELEQPGVLEDWSMKDLLGHIAFWSRQGADNLRLIAAGRADEVQRPGSDEAVGEWNERERQLRHDRSLSEVREEWLDSFQRAMQALADFPAEKLKEEVQGRAVLKLFGEDTHAHYREHLAHLADWRRKLDTTET